MSDLKDLEAPDAVKLLSILANKGAEKSFNLDLVKLENLSGIKADAGLLISLAMLGAESDEEVAFCKAAISDFMASSQDD